MHEITNLLQAQKKIMYFTRRRTLRVLITFTYQYNAMQSNVVISTKSKLYLRGTCQRRIYYATLDVRSI